MKDTHTNMLLSTIDGLQRLITKVDSIGERSFFMTYHFVRTCWIGVILACIVLTLSKADEGGGGNEDGDIDSGGEKMINRYPRMLCLSRKD